MKTLIKSNSSLGLCSRNGKGLPILPFLGITALVVWGAYLFSTVGFSLTPLAISLTYISPYIKGIIIGLILGDGSLQLLKGRKNASFRLGQCSANSGFLWHVFSLLQHYCQSYPSPYFGIRKGRPNFGLFIRTRSYPIFTELYHLFHRNGRKTIPWCIAELLTPQGLAMWAMSDGRFADAAQNLQRLKEVSIYLPTLFIMRRLNSCVTLLRNDIILIALFIFRGVNLGYIFTVLL